LAATWATLGRDPDAQELAQARGFAGKDSVMEVLLSVSIARNGRAPELATAYTRIAAVLVETMALRAAHGSARGDLDAVAAAIDAPLCSNLHHQYICGADHVVYYHGLYYSRRSR
jgi:hypothetical protein